MYYNEDPIITSATGFTWFDLALDNSVVSMQSG